MRIFWIVFFTFFFLFPVSAHAKRDHSEYYRGLELYHAGDFEGALSAFENQLKKTPDDEAVKKWQTLTRKRVLGVASAGGSALEAVTGGSSEKPNDVRVVPETARAPSTSASAVPFTDDYELGIDLYLNGNFPSSLEAFQRFLKSNPGHAATQQWIHLVESVSVASRTGEDIPKIPSFQETARPSTQALPSQKMPLPISQGSPLLQMTLNLQESESARLDAESKLAEASRRQQILEAENNRWRETEERLLESLKKKEIELQDARQELERQRILETRLNNALRQLNQSEQARSELEGVARETEKAMNRLSGELQAAKTARLKIESLLEESRQQGLTLVTQLEKEREERQTLERILAEREKMHRSQIQSIRDELNKAFSSIQAIPSSVRPDPPFSSSED